MTITPNSFHLLVLVLNQYYIIHTLLCQTILKVHDPKNKFLCTSLSLSLSLYIYIYIYTYIYRGRFKLHLVQLHKSYTFFFFFYRRLPLDLMVTNILCLVINILNIASMSNQKIHFTLSFKIKCLLSPIPKHKHSLSNLISFSMASPFPSQDT